MKIKILVSCIAISFISTGTRAAVIFSDNFSTFSLGTTWTNSGYGNVPNRVLSSNGNQLNMQSNAGYGDAFAVSTTVPTPLTGFGDLSITVAFTPLAGWLTPFEFVFDGENSHARFINGGSGQWNSDGTNTPYTGAGNWSNNTTYTGTFNITSSGTSLSVQTSGTTVFARNFNFNRSDVGNRQGLTVRRKRALVGIQKWRLQT